MTEVFDRAVNFTLQWEGGLSDVAQDHGGLTKYGISQRAYPRLNIRDLTLADAKEIYARDYWRPLRGDQLPPALAVICFDFAVHAGVHRAVTTLQHRIGVRDDGVIGPVTVGAARTADLTETVQKLVTDRADFLLSLAERHVDQQKFLRGWMRRTHALAFLVGGLV